MRIKNCLIDHLLSKLIRNSREEYSYDAEKVPNANTVINI